MTINPVSESDYYLNSGEFKADLTVKKDIRTPYNLKVDKETLVLTFNHDNLGNSYTIKLYDENGTLIRTKTTTLDTIDLLDLFSDYTFENAKYKVSVTSTSDSDVYNDSDESDLKSFRVKLTD